MGYEEVLDEMEDLLEKAWKVPMGGGKSVLDVSAFQRLIKDLRLSVPREITEANRIVNNKEQIIQDAKNKCEDVYKMARKKVSEMAEEHEIVKLAKKREADILKKCQDKCKEMATKARNESLGCISDCEKNLVLQLENMRNFKQNLKVIKI